MKGEKGQKRCAKSEKKGGRERERVDKESES